MKYLSVTIPLVRWVSGCCEGRSLVEERSLKNQPFLSGVLSQLKMTVWMRTQESRMARMLQRRIIAWLGVRQRSRSCEEGCKRHSNQCDSYKRSFLLEMLKVNKTLTSENETSFCPVRLWTTITRWRCNRGRQSPPAVLKEAKHVSRNEGYYC